MKSHYFQGSGPGFPCQYISDSKKCTKMVDDPIHVQVTAQEAIKKMMAGMSSTGQREQFWPGSAEAVWQSHADAVAALLKKKQAYGDAWKEQGYMGNLARVLSKVSRLKNMLWREQPWLGTGGEESEVEKESALDTLYDLSALCALAIANIEEGNRWGQ